MGGEAIWAWPVTEPQPGPSPRGRGSRDEGSEIVARPGSIPACGRGSHDVEIISWKPYRSIPAWAGKPSPSASSVGPSKVHPRVGGEACASNGRTTATCGPSPRGRGSLSGGLYQAPSFGSIPAWAGKPSLGAEDLPCRTVHPRVGGEALSRERKINRMKGPSPRGRGSPLGSVMQLIDGGSIPAWAGKPGQVLAPAPLSGVHPRVGGEAPASARSCGSSAGPSPRGRGSRWQTRRPGASTRSIPAWAGKPGGGGASGRQPRVHPRVGGEARLSLQLPGDQRGPSPRGRGSQASHSDRDPPGRSIPAWAGKPRHPRGHEGGPAVHPRVGGEAIPDTSPRRYISGPSPRGRGSQQDGRLSA